MKYITCIDIETTGLNRQADRIIQLAMVKVDATTFDKIKECNWYIKPSGIWGISESAREIHNISKDFIEANGVSLVSIYDEFIKILEDSYILTYNGTTFDIPFIQREFEKEGLDPHFDKMEFIDAYDIEKRTRTNKLVDVYQRYYGKTFEDAHNAYSDVNATIDVYRAQLNHLNSDLISSSVEFTTKNTSASPEGFVQFNSDDVLVFNVGKYKGVPVSTVCVKDPGYIRWLFASHSGGNIITIPTKNAIRVAYNNYKESLNS